MRTESKHSALSSPIPRLLKRKMYKEELEPNWPGPDKVTQFLSSACCGFFLPIQLRDVCLLIIALFPIQLWDWDMWMRVDSIRKSRSVCLLTLPGTAGHMFHSDLQGVHHPRYFQNLPLWSLRAQHESLLPGRAGSHPTPLLRSRVCGQ